MTTVTLPYGPAHIIAELPDDATIIESGGGSRLTPLPDTEQAIRDALATPLGMPPLAKLVGPTSRVTVAFDDLTVAQTGPVRQQIVEAVIDDLTRAGVPDENIRLICANALHRKWTRAELAVAIGQPLVDRFDARLACHDAEDAANIVSLGQTAHGYDVDVHRAVVESDLTIYVNGGVTLGFSGGWKSVTIGLSTWRSIRATHTPDGMSMSVRNNRMHRVLDEMGEHLEATLGIRIFKVETALAGYGRVAGVWAGTVAETRARAIEMMAAANPPRRGAGEPVDVIVYGIPDESPYAAFASLNPILTLVSTGLGYRGGYIEALGKPGCSVILATPCPERWDMEHHPSYKEAWERVLPQSRDPYAIMERFEPEFASHPGYIAQYRDGVAFHPIHAILALQPLKRLRHAGQVFVAGADDPDVPRHVGFTPTASVEEAIAQARRIHGADCRIACITEPPRAAPTPGIYGTPEA